MKTDVKYDWSELDRNRFVYCCSTCDKLFNWSNKSLMFLSLKQPRNYPESISYIYSCSDKCKGVNESLN